MNAQSEHRSELQAELQADHHADHQFDHPDVVLCPGGPMLLRGKHTIRDADGVPHETTRPVTAVCRCDKSASFPWCDGTHKVLPAKLRPA